MSESSGEKQVKHGAERLKPWQFKKGQSGNPAGRPPGRSLKDYAKKYLAGMTDEERIEFFEGIDKIKIWEMAEGKPETKTDLTSDGKPITISFDPSLQTRHAQTPQSTTEDSTKHEEV